MNKDEIIRRLQSTGKEQEELWRKAALQKLKFYQNKVLIRGVIEVSNLCRVSCDYCPMRKENAQLNKGYILNADEIVEAVRPIKKHGINVVFFQAGEIKKTVSILAKAIPMVKDLYHGDVEVLLNIGIQEIEAYRYLKIQGADSFLMKHETSDPFLHEQLRKEQLEWRLYNLRTLKQLGYKIGTGNIIGLPGQSIGSIADDILLAMDLNVDMASSAPFLPAPNTPLQGYAPGSVSTTLNSIALMRILIPHALIPSVSALEKIETGAQLRGLNVGANVVTVNFTPDEKKKDYLIYGKNRYIVKLNYVQRMLQQGKLIPMKSTFVKQSEYLRTTIN